MTPRHLGTALILLALGGFSEVRADEKTIALFDGKTLDGWKKVNGGASYHIEGDTIVGVVNPESKRNTFLRTEKTYRNFRLELDLKLDIPGNSGIQFRSHQRASENDRVYGYQCEVDPSPRAWTGGIYDEGNRGWLFPLTGHPEAQKAYKKDAWNHFVIEARGPLIKTWLNGVACADLIDTLEDEGFIALQVHAGKEGRIRWKNINLTEYPDSPWSPAWDGKTLQGWNASGGGHWSVENGAIHGTSTTSEKVHGHLFSDATLSDFAVRFKVKPSKGNSGLYFRAGEGGKSGVTGIQVDIDPKENTGGLYEIDGRGWLTRPKPEDLAKWLTPNAWNNVSVVAVGDRIVVHLNGQKTAEIRDEKVPRAGKLALQVHAGQDVDVWFKDIEVLKLDGAR